MSAMSAASSGLMKTLSGGGSGGVQGGGAALMPLSLIAEHKVGPPNPPPQSQPLARTPPEKLPVAAPSVPKPTANGMEPPQATAPLPLLQPPHPQQQQVPDLPPPVAAAPDPPPVLPVANNSQPSLPCGGREAENADGMRRFDEANNVNEGSVGGTNSVPTPSPAEQQHPVVGAVAPVVVPPPQPTPPSPQPPPPVQPVVPPPLPAAAVPPLVVVPQEPIEVPPPQPLVPQEEPASSQPAAPVEARAASPSAAPSPPSNVAATAQTPQEPSEPVKVSPPPPSSPSSAAPPAKPAVAPVVTEAKVPPPAKTPRRAKPAESRREKGIVAPMTASTPGDDEGNSADGRKSQRKRLPTQPYQSPYPVLNIIAKINKIDKTPNKANEEKLIVFYKHEFLAVRNDEGSFYVCQAMQNIYKTTSKIKIRWLSSTPDATGNDIYTPDFYDTTDFDCILTNLNLEKVEKDKFKLPDVELQRTQSILKRAIDVEKGVAENPTVTEEHPDGLDLSLYRNEEQLKKRKTRRAKREEESDEEAEPVRRSTRPRKAGRRGKKRGRGKREAVGAKVEKVEAPVASPTPAPESRTVKRKAGAAVNRKLDAAIGSKKKKLGPSRKEAAPPSKAPPAGAAESKTGGNTRGSGGSPAAKRKGPPVGGNAPAATAAPPPPEKRSRRGTTAPASTEPPSSSSKTKTLDAVVMRLKDRKRVQ